eukprot:TRINITY_DN33794_c0_g1_i1.p1 TRINITY_DN33794_c0_g1~~TRINITY_DN33794_c0_g1_i1.p1  ORF type:complete len:239 (+),score=37.09 TRINITY_DN33794_c0_g1_i1:39-755(+)
MAMLPLWYWTLLMPFSRLVSAVAAAPPLHEPLPHGPPRGPVSSGFLRPAFGSPMQSSFPGWLRIVAALTALGYAGYLVLQTMNRRKHDFRRLEENRVEEDKQFADYTAENPKYCHDREGFAMWKDHRRKKAEFQEEQARRAVALAAAEWAKAQKKAEQEERFEKDRCDWRGPGGVKDSEVRVIMVPKPKVRPGAYAKHMAEYYAKKRAEDATSQGTVESVQSSVRETPLTSIPEEQGV